MVICWYCLWRFYQCQFAWICQDLWLFVDILSMPICDWEFMNASLPEWSRRKVVEKIGEGRRQWAVVFCSHNHKPAQNCAILVTSNIKLPLAFLDNFVRVQHPLWGLTLVLLQGSWYAFNRPHGETKTVIKLTIKWRGCASKGALTSRGSSKVGRAPSFSSCLVTILIVISQQWFYHPHFVTILINVTILVIPMMSMTIILSNSEPHPALSDTAQHNTYWRHLKKIGPWNIIWHKFRVLSVANTILAGRNLRAFYFYAPPWQTGRRKEGRDKQRRVAEGAALQCLHIIFCLRDLPFVLLLICF